MRLLIFYALVCILLQYSCSAQYGSLDLGKSLTTEQKSKCKDIYVMSSSGKLTKGLSCNAGGIEYKLVLDGAGKVTMITTNDSLLNTERGFKIGSTYKEIKAYEVSKYYEAGWGYVVDVGDKWKCVFWNDLIRDKQELKDTAAVAFFLQGK